MEFKARASKAQNLLSLPRSKKDREAGLMGDTAKGYVREQWLTDNYQIREQINTNAINKGILQEDVSIALLSLVDEDFYYKNEESRDDDYFTGTPDLVTKDLIIDIKTSETAKSFMSSDITPLYATQLQVYMHLFGKKKAELVYCLVNAPEYQMERKNKAKYWDLMEQSEHIDEEAMEIFENQTMLNMTFDRIDPKLRIKRFSVDFDQTVIDSLIEQIKNARNYYNNLQLNK
jgi:hypothetical protein